MNSYKKDINFQSQESLQTVQKIIDEANAAVQNKNRNINQSAIPDFVSKANVVNNAKSLKDIGITFENINPVFVQTTIPVITLKLAKCIENQKLKKPKEFLYKEAIRKQNAIMEALSNEAFTNQSRIKYLTALSTLLQATIHDLKHDLGY